ncbi:MAG: 50S ribosomal protein L24 [Candidatus Methylomirabilales bacterium]
MALRIRKGDRVHVLTGKDAGKEGRVIAVLPKKNRVLVEGVSRVKRHEKVRPARGRSGQEGGIITTELPVDLSNVTLVCPNCGPTRVGLRIDPDKSRARICRSCGREL